MYWCCKWYKEQQLKKKEKSKSKELNKRERILERIEWTVSHMMKSL